MASNLTLSEMLPQDKRRLHELEQQLIELEKGSSNSRVQASDIFIGLSEMSARLEELDRLVAKEPKEKREDCKRRVLHLRNSHAHLKSSLDSIVKKKNLKMAGSFNMMKQELFEGADLEGGFGADGVSDTRALLGENASLGRSASMVNSYLAIGQETLTELFSQRDRVKGVQRKVFDMMNYLGISNSIMKSVEKREAVDKWIVYIGMILITALIFILWWFFKR